MCVRDVDVAKASGQILRNRMRAAVAGALGVGCGTRENAAREKHDGQMRGNPSHSRGIIAAPEPLPDDK